MELFNREEDGTRWVDLKDIAPGSRYPGTAKDHPAQRSSAF